MSSSLLYKIAPDYLARKQHFALQATDLSIFNHSRRPEISTRSADNHHRSKIRLSLFQQNSSINDIHSNNSKSVLKRLRYNQQSGLYSPNDACLQEQLRAIEDDDEDDDEEEYPDNDSDKNEHEFVWEMNLQDIFPMSRTGHASINRMPGHCRFNGQTDLEEGNEVTEEEKEIYIIQQEIQDRAAWQSIVTSSTSIGSMSFL